MEPLGQHPDLSVAAAIVPFVQISILAATNLANSSPGQPGAALVKYSVQIRLFLDVQ
jgi:hypothetical protein